MPGGGGGGPVGRGGALINPAESSLQGTTCPKRLALSVPLLAILSLSACGCRAARGAGRVCLSQGLCTLQRRTGSARAKDYRTQRCGNRCNSDIYIYIYIYMKPHHQSRFHCCTSALCHRIFALVSGVQRPACGQSSSLCFFWEHLAQPDPKHHAAVSRCSVKISPTGFRLCRLREGGQ